MKGLLILVLSMLCAAPTSAAPAGTLAGTLRTPGLWQAYKQSFVSPGGRVIDNANGGISHSEGQGYGMLLALAADDAGTFEQIWTWTRSQLMLRDDGLAAWRWDPAATPHVTDRNNATDGDILIAWALTEAGDAWAKPAYRSAGLLMIRSIADNDVANSAYGPILKPGTAGFAAKDRPDGPVVNLSYWIFPALERFAAVAPDLPFAALSISGLKLLAAARFGSQHLPSDWISLAGEAPAPAKNFPPAYGYDAIRVPLYLIWAGQRDGKTLMPFAFLYADPAAIPARLDVSTGKSLESMSDSGYRAVAALTRCALHQTHFPNDLQAAEVDRYYPSTLRALVLVAARQTAAQCL